MNLLHLACVPVLYSCSK